MNLEDIVLREISQTQKDKHFVCPWSEVYGFTYVRDLEREIYGPRELKFRDRKYNGGYQGLGLWEYGESLFSG